LNVFIENKFVEIFDDVGEFACDFVVAVLDVLVLGHVAMFEGFVPLAGEVELVFVDVLGVFVDVFESFDFVVESFMFVEAFCGIECADEVVGLL
jgi:hypothetical protein